MGKTSAEVKNRYNAKHYERIALSVPIGTKEEWKAVSESEETSLNALIVKAVSEYIKQKQIESR